MQKESLAGGDYLVAREAMEKIDELPVSPGTDYFFYRGQLEVNAENDHEANAALVIYVNKAGREGEYYQQALRLITALEQRKILDSDTSARLAEAGQISGDGEDYMAQLQKLYLTQSPVRALTEHINSILAENTFVPGRIRHPGLNEGLVYKVSVNSVREVVVQESDYRRTTPGHNMRRAVVYGVDPYIANECDYDRRMCWLYHPVEKQERWITIADNKEALTELSRAMTQLIRQLQN